MATFPSASGRWTRRGSKTIWRTCICLLILLLVWAVSTEPLQGFLRGYPSTDTRYMCRKYPDAGDIVVSVRTGATEAMRKLPSILDTSLKCVREPLIFSDLNQTINGIQIHDVLSRFSPAAIAKNEDFDIYRTQLDLQLQGREGEIEALAYLPAHINDYNTEGHPAAWALDKYKFIHMLEMAYELQPGKQWYVFLEPDTYLSWPNLNRFLRTMDPSQKLYIGNAIHKTDDKEPRYFAHGGSGFVLSGATLREFAVDRKEIAASLEARMHEYWAGDFALADALYDHMELEVTSASPMLNQQSPRSFPFGEGRWCEPVISLHHMQPRDFAEILSIEQKSSFSSFYLRDIYASTYPSGLPTERSDWDNAAEDDEFVLDGNAKVLLLSGEFLDPNTSPQSCRTACEYNVQCFQYTWRNTTIDVLGKGFDSQHSCVLSRVFRLGKYKEPQEFWGNIKEKDTYKAWHSGWLTERIEKWIQQHWRCSRGDHWVTHSV